jgi:hypothetical protein
MVGTGDGSRSDDARRRCRGVRTAVRRIRSWLTGLDKAAFVVPEPLEDLAIKLGTLIDDADQSLTRTDRRG